MVRYRNKNKSKMRKGFKKNCTNCAIAHIPKFTTDGINMIPVSITVQKVKIVILSGSETGEETCSVGTDRP